MKINSGDEWILTFVVPVLALECSVVIKLWMYLGSGY